MGRAPRLRARSHLGPRRGSRPRPGGAEDLITGAEARAMSQVRPIRPRAKSSVPWGLIGMAGLGDARARSPARVASNGEHRGPDERLRRWIVRGDPRLNPPSTALAG